MRLWLNGTAPACQVGNEGSTPSSRTKLSPPMDSSAVGLLSPLASVRFTPGMPMPSPLDCGAWSPKPRKRRSDSD